MGVHFCYSGIICSKFERLWGSNYPACVNFDWCISNKLHSPNNITQIT